MPRLGILSLRKMQANGVVLTKQQYGRIVRADVAKAQHRQDSVARFRRKAEAIPRMPFSGLVISRTIARSYQYLFRKHVETSEKAAA